MFNFWIFLLLSNFIAWMTLVPFLDKNLSLFDRTSRIKIIHRLFTLRNKFSSIFSRRSSDINSDAKALNEILSLYYPTFQVNDDLHTIDIDQLRFHSQRLLTSLYPQRSSSCLIEKETIYDNQDHSIDLYVIQNDPTVNWNNSARPVIVYFHGGGFVYGGNETYFGLECSLAADLNMIVIHVDFALAPEQPFSRTFKDISYAYDYLFRVDSTIHRRLIGMGDSSGGMLWISLLEKLVEQNKPVPHAVILHSPWINFDFTNINLSIRTTFFMSIDFMFFLRDVAIGKGIDNLELTEGRKKNKKNKSNDAFQGFPPMYITVGTQDVFVDEIRLMAKKMQKSGGDVILDVSQGSMHSFALFYLWTSEACCAQKKIQRWIHEQFHPLPSSSWESLLQPRITCKL